MSLSVTAPAAQFIQGVVSYQSYAPGPLVLVEHADIVVIAEDFSYFAIGETDVDGAYSVKVAPGLSYEVIADGGPPYLPQAWEQDINCGCDYDPVTVGNAGDPPTTGIDFHLYTEADTVVFDLYTSLFNGNDFEGVTVHVYQQVAGVWTETMASDTDPYGRMLLYGLDVDEYRVSFTDGTTALPIVDVEDTNNPGALPLDSTCYFEFDAEIGDYYEYDFHLNQTATAGVCGNPAAPPSSGGGSSVHHSSGGTTTGSTSTPTPTPTPTATTDPGDDGDGGSVPGRSTDDAAETPDVSAPGFPWLGILIVVIIVLCVGGTGFVILRRR
jgi:hypothetical protein